MYLTLNGVRHELIDIREFRERWQLPASFAASLFEPKDYSGLGSIENAGTALNRVRTAVLDAVPSRLVVTELPDLLDRLRQVYHRKLLEINDQVRLHEVEIDFAVAGFEDMNRALLYAIIQARATNSEPPPFLQVYGQWLDDSTRVSQRTHNYTHQGKQWSVQIINTVYGRAGLIVEMGDEVVYLADNQLACPAEGFMFNLLKDLAARVGDSLRVDEKKPAG